MDRCKYSRIVDDRMICIAYDDYCLLEDEEPILKNCKEEYGNPPKCNIDKINIKEDQDVEDDDLIISDEIGVEDE